MRCPLCNTLMNPESDLWVCADHGPQALLSNSERALITLAANLPLPLAVVLSEYVREDNSFVKLHRLTDAAEIITRFLAMVLLSDVLRQRGEFPSDVYEGLVDRIERPTFGAWKDLLRLACNQLSRQRHQVESFVPSLPAFVEDILLPALGSNDGDVTKHLIPLRNALVHAGRVPDAQAEEWLSQHRVQFERLFTALASLSDYLLVASTEDGRVVSLKGSPPTDGTFPEIDPLTTREPVAPGRVVLVHGSEVLDLFPLHAFGEVFHHREDTFDRAGDPAPHLYFRTSDKGYLEFTTLSGRVAFGQQRGAALERFREVFRLEEWKRNRVKQPRPQANFGDLLTELGEVFVGRDADVQQVKQHLKAHRQGILWIPGRPGVGKSALMAKLVDDYSGQLQHYLTIPYFFRIGHAHCSVDQFLSASLAQLLPALGDSSTVAPNPKERRQQFIEAVRNAGEQTGRRVLFLVDGLDEIHRVDVTFTSLLATATNRQVLWVCAGRGDVTLEEFLRKAGAEWVFPGGLPQLGTDAIRSMLTAHLDRLKYELFARDQGEHNRFVEVLTQRSEGLPLYIRMVVEDLRVGKRTLADEDGLPNGLRAYFEQVLQRLQVSDVGTVLTPLFCLLSWAREPVTGATLRTLLSDHFLSRTSRWESTVQEAFEHGHMMLRPTTTPEGRPGWTLYHDSFRQHLRTTASVAGSSEWAQEEWLHSCSRWQETNEESLQRYALRQYPEHLHEASSWDELFALAESTEFLDAQAQTLADEPNAPLRTLQRALDGAIAEDDAGRMASFVLDHASHWTAISEECPLAALRDGQDHRAWELVNLMAVEDRVLFHLLLAWELADGARHDEALEVLHRLAALDLPRSSDTSDTFLLLLASAFHVSQEAFRELLHRLLEADALPGLSRQLAVFGHFDAAVALLADIGDISLLHVDALRLIGSVQARRGDRDAARATFATALERIAWFEDSQFVGSESDKEQAVMSEVDSLCQIAAAQTDMGEREAALATFEAAVVKVARTDWSDRSRREEETLLKVIKAQAAAGEHDVARVTATRLINGIREWYIELTDLDLQFIAVAQAYTNEVTTALETVQQIKTESLKAVGLQEIAVVQAEAGEFAAALIVAEAIGDEAVRTGALRRISGAQAEHGELAAARQTAENLQHEARVESLTRIALAEADAGDRDSARATFANALSIALNLENYTRDSVLQELATAQAQVGESPLALQTAQNVRSKTARSRVLHTIAVAQIEAGDRAASRGTLALAVQLTPLDGQTALKARTLAKIGLTQVHASHKDAGRATLAAAVEMIGRINNYQDHRDPLWNVLWALCDSGEFTLARQIAMRFERVLGDKQWYVDQKIAELVQKRAIAYASSREFVAALQLAQKSILGQRAETLRFIAMAQVRAGEFVAAAQTAWQMEDNKRERAELLCDIVAAQAKAGKSRGALLTAQGIDIAEFRAEALRIIGLTQVQTGEPAAARTTFIAAVECTWRIEESERGRDWTLADIALQRPARMVGFLHEDESAYSVWSEHDEVWRGRGRVWTLVFIACAQAQAEDKFNFHQTIALAFSAAEAIKDPESRAEAFRAIAIAQLYVGENEAARTALATAMMHTQTMRDGPDQARQLARIAGVQAELGDRDAARAIFKSIFETASKLARTVWTEVFEDAVAMMRSLLVEQIRVTELSGALETANAFEDYETRVSALLGVAVAHEKAGDRDSARRVFADAFKVARWVALRFNFEEDRFDAQINVVRAQAHVLDYADAIEKARQIDDLEAMAKATTVVAAAQAQSGDREAARNTLANAVEGLLRLQPAWSRDGALYDLAMEQARQGLCAEAVQTVDAVVMGRASSISRVAAVVVEGRDKPAFQRLLHPGAYFLDAAYEMCGLLAHLYPDQASVVTKVVMAHA